MLGQLNFKWILAENKVKNRLLNITKWKTPFENNCRLSKIRGTNQMSILTPLLTIVLVNLQLITWYPYPMPYHIWYFYEKLPFLCISFVLKKKSRSWITLPLLLFNNLIWFRRIGSEDQNMWSSKTIYLLDSVQRDKIMQLKYLHVGQGVDPREESIMAESAAQPVQGNILVRGKCYDDTKRSDLGNNLHSSCILWKIQIMLESKGIILT